MGFCSTFRSLSLPLLPWLRPTEASKQTACGWGPRPPCCQRAKQRHTSQHPCTCSPLPSLGLCLHAFSLWPSHLQSLTCPPTLYLACLWLGTTQALPQSFPHREQKLHESKIAVILFEAARAVPRRAFGVADIQYLSKGSRRKQQRESGYEKCL